jgi:hypothetical protein
MAVSRRSGLLPPRVVQTTSVDRVEAKLVDEAKHGRPGVQRVAGDRERDSPVRAFRSAVLQKALGEDAVERLDHGPPDLLRDPLAVEHAAVDRIDAAIAQLRMVVADIDHDDAVRHVREQPPRKAGDGLRWDREEDDLSGVDGVDDGSGRRADVSGQGRQAFRSPRVRDRDAVAQPDEAARKHRPHASCADDSDAHGLILPNQRCPCPPCRELSCGEAPGNRGAGEPDLSSSRMASARRD